MNDEDQIIPSTVIITTQAADTTTTTTSTPLPSLTEEGRPNIKLNFEAISSTGSQEDVSPMVTPRDDQVSRTDSFGSNSNSPRSETNSPRASRGELLSPSGVSRFLYGWY